MTDRRWRFNFGRPFFVIFRPNASSDPKRPKRWSVELVKSYPTMSNEPTFRYKMDPLFTIIALWSTSCLLKKWKNRINYFKIYLISPRAANDLIVWARHSSAWLQFLNYDPTTTPHHGHLFSFFFKEKIQNSQKINLNISEIFPKILRLNRPTFRLASRVTFYF